MPPYIPLPYASDQPAYSNRDYTLKQMQLLEQQAAREAAYERERGTMMAGRWAGLGGLATETLGSLVQARDLRQAKALEQARYGSEQARLDRAESDRTRAFDAATARYLREDEWRRNQTDKAERLRRFGELEKKDLDTIFTPEEIALWKEFSPVPLDERQQLQAITAAPSNPTQGNVLGRARFGDSPQQRQGVGSDTFGQVTFGGPPIAREDTPQNRNVFPSAPQAEPGPAEFRRPRSAVEVRNDAAVALQAEQNAAAAKLRQDEIAYRAGRDVIEEQARIQAQANVDRAFRQQAGNQTLIREQENRASQEKKELIAAQIDMVIKNPSSFMNLPLATQATIGPALEARGFTGFGKPMSDSALTSIAESNSAMKGLDNLRQTVLDNKDMLGPIVGLAALNPYSQSRKVQAELNVIKQRVGKQLEGGVLRKEDEIKYKEILANLYDVPDLALSKIDNMMRLLERDLKSFTDAQLMSGRRPMDSPPKPTPKPTVPNVLNDLDKRYGLGRTLNW